MHPLRLLPSLSILSLALIVAPITPSAAATAAPPSSTGVLVDDPAVMGQWHGVMEWPDKAVHSILLHTGKVLWFRGEADPGLTYTWDPITNIMSTQSFPEMVFCAGHSVLPDGRVLVTGGRLGDSGSLGPKHTFIFDPVSETWSRGPDMRLGRYYPTNLLLGDGRTLVFSGYDDTHTVNEMVESFMPGTGPGGTDQWELIAGANYFMAYYPRMHLLSDGKVVHVGKAADGAMLDLDTGGWTPIAESNYGSRSEGTSVALPPGFNKIMIVGGGSNTETAEIIDFNDPVPTWRYTAPMAHGRSHLNSLILPDGTVLVAGGSNSETVFPAEIFDPITETWRTVASMNTFRLYHSSAVLLPDGRCLWAGSDDNNSGEVYSPPYLFKGPRPTMGATPNFVEYGQSFAIPSPEAASIGSIVLIRPSSTTHAFNQDQRFVPLNYTRSGTTLNVSTPTNPNIAPPGYYLLFILNGDKIPSVGRFVKLGGDPPPTSGNRAPVVNAGPDQTIRMPQTATLSALVSDEGLIQPLPTLSWSQVAGPGVATFGSPAAATTTVSFSEAGTYMLRFAAFDGELTGADVVTVNVRVPCGTDEFVERRITLGAEDAEESATGTVAVSGNDLELVHDGNLQTVGLRFTGLDIPQGSVIINAYVQFTSNEATSELTTLRIEGQDADSAGVFTTAARNVSSRPRTDASVIWSPEPWTAANLAGSAQRTPDLADIIQEISDRPTWGGNSVALILTGTGRRAAKSFETLASAAPLLRIDYVCGSTNRRPRVNAGPDQTLSFNPLLTPRPVANLAGTSTDDGQPIPPGSLVSTWRQTGGPAGVTFGDSLSPATTASFPGPGTYELSLTGNDGRFSATDRVTIKTRLVCGGEGVLDTRIAAGADDAEESASGSVALTGNDLELVNDGNLQTIGLRFTGIDILRGAVITKAWIQFMSHAATSDVATLRIQGEDADTSAVFTTATRNVSLRPRTDAFVDWTPAAWPTVNVAGADQRTPDLAAVIQEIVDRTGWQAKSLSLVLTGTGLRTAKSFEGLATGAALLHIEYGCEGTNRRPSANAGPDQMIVFDPARTPRPTASLTGQTADDGLPVPPASVRAAWRQVSGPAGVTFADSLARNTTASFPGAGTYVLSLTAFDGALTATDQVSITMRSCVGSVDRRIAVGADDAEESASGSVTLTGNDLELVNDGNLQTIGLRFTGVDILPSAVITSAYIQFMSHAVSSDVATLRIQGEDADTSAVFTTATRNVSLRARTDAFVNWTPAAWPTVNVAGADQRTPDLSAVIQEIVDRGGWQGKSLSLVITGTGMRNAKSFEGLATGAALLHVEYGCGNRRPVVDAGPDQNIVYTPELATGGLSLEAVIPTATLAGRVTDDGLPDPPRLLTSKWRRVSGPTGVTFADSLAPATTVTFPGQVNGTYVLSLTGDDGALTTTDQVSISVGPFVAAPNILDRAITLGSDDCEEAASGSVALTSSDLEMMLDGASPQRAVGLRFSSLAIPPGANITAAWVQFKAKEAHTEATNLIVKAQAIDNAPTFTSAASNVTSRATTTASAAWSTVPAWVVNAATTAQRTADLKSVIQEVVSRPGWASGNALALIVTGAGRRVAHAFENGAANAAVLHVEFLTGPPPPPPPVVNQPPVVNAGPDTTVMLTGAAFLRGTTTDDGLNSPLTRMWTKRGGPGTVTFDNASSAATRATFGAAGSYRLELMAMDGQYERRDSVTVTVLDPSNLPTLLDRAIVAGSDDCEESATGSVSTSSSDLEMMLDGASAQRAVGLRFTTLAIPPGANITAAWVQFKAKEAHTEATNLVVKAQAIDNAPTFTSAASNVTSRATTTASAAWSTVPAWVVNNVTAAQRTADLKSVIQEVVSRPGWASGNALALIVTGAGRRVAHAFENGAANAAVLHIEFLTGPPPPPPPVVNQPPVVNAGPDTTVMLTGAAFLRGTTTDDGLNSPLTRMWTKRGGPGTVSFDNATSAATRATFGAAGSYRLELMAMDGQYERRDSVTVTVLDPSNLPTILDRAIVASSDDVEEQASGSVSTSSSDLEMMLDGSSAQRAVGLRFTTLAIPPGANITAAWVQFKAKEAHTEATNLIVKAQAIDNAPTFTSAANNVTSRATTTASAAWSTVPAWVVNNVTAAQRTADLKSVIQEVVNRPGWASGNALALIVTGAGRRVAHAYDNGAANAPVLHIEYLNAPPPPPPVVNQAPTANAGPDTTVTWNGTSGVAFLHAQSSDDGLPGPLENHWEPVSGPGLVTFDDHMTRITRATFGAIGVYRLRFTAMDGALEARDTMMVVVTAPASTNGIPVASLTVTPTTGVAPLAVLIDASASSDPDGDALTYTFDFGDVGGGAAMACGPDGSCCCAPAPCNCHSLGAKSPRGALEAAAATNNPVATHQYAAGSWTVRVTVSDGRGGSATATAVVNAYTNMVANPGFETAITGWNANGTRASVARVAGGRTGGFCIQATGDSLPANTFGVNDAPNVVSPVAGPGTVYRFGAWVRSAAHSGKVQIRVREYLNGVLQGAQYVSPLTTLTPAWQFLTLDVAATVAGSTLDFQVMNKPVQGREVFQVDDFSVFLLPAPAALAGGVETELEAEPADAPELHAFHAPAVTRLAAVFPNPSPGSATLRFELAREEQVDLSVYDLRGALVRRIASGPRGAGIFNETWDGRDHRGNRLPVGMYLVRFSAGPIHQSRKLVLTP